MRGFLPVSYWFLILLHCGHIILSMEYYQIFETSLEAWPFFVNVLFVFEKNVYSVFAGCRVLYICLLDQAYGVQIFHLHDNFFPGFSISNQVSCVRVSHGDWGFVSHYVHFLFTSTCLVYLFCPLTSSVFSFFLAFYWTDRVLFIFFHLPDLLGRCIFYFCSFGAHIKIFNQYTWPLSKLITLYSFPG